MTRDKKAGVPMIGSSGILDLGKKLEGMWAVIVILSDHIKDEEQEKVAFTYKKEEEALTQKDKVLKEGVHIKTKDHNMHVFYPIHEIRKIIIQYQLPAKHEGSDKDN